MYNKDNMIWWMEQSQEAVLDTFLNLPRAKTEGRIYDQTVSIYIPGTRKDRVVLVAHSDTVWQDSFKSKNVRCNQLDNIIYSERPSCGIGADDRVGCYILWQLRNLGHSLLITSGEESCCVGSRNASIDLLDELNNEHCFMVQFDRKGTNELVFYGVGTQEFAKYCSENTGFKIDRGTYTDIVFLCEKICGVNISCGYYNEHSTYEYILEDVVYKNVAITKQWLKKDQQKFILPEKKYVKKSNS